MSAPGGRLRVVGDEHVCVGAGMCVLTAPEVFDQDDDGIVVVLDEQPSDDLAPVVREAASLCPSGAVKFTQE